MFSEKSSTTILQKALRQFITILLTDNVTYNFDAKLSNELARTINFIWPCHL